MGNEVIDESIDEESIEPEEAQYKYIIGIDLGTTNSAVSYVDLTINRHRKKQNQVSGYTSIGSAGRNRPTFRFAFLSLYSRLLRNAGREYIASMGH